ncbi:MAG: tyrosine-type recombinase/integrase [Alphaproteobacteria bacterium]|nr:tyrosine-type recombinase/integrase [Alphaproteobacteria bacterium]
MRLTIRSIETVPAGNSDVFAWDDLLPGFGLRVKPSGVRSFVIQYRNRQGRSRRLTIGRHGVLTPEEARKEAKLRLAEVQKGEDPVELRERERHSLSVAKLCERYMEEHALVHKKPRSASQDRRLIDNRINPAMGSLKVEQITRADILKLQNEMRNTPYEANRALALLSKMFNLAEAWEIRALDTNPCRHIKKNKEQKRERFLSADELSNLGAYLTEAKSNAILHPTMIAGIRLLLMTGCRLSEVCGFRWDGLNAEAGTLRLADSKTGAKTIYLSHPALDVIKGLKKESDWMLPSRHDSELPMKGDALYQCWKVVRAALGFKEVRLHDLRHTFASWAVMGGQSLPVTGALLGHTAMQTTNRYAHFASNPLREAANLVGGEIAKAMGQNA